MVPRPQPLAAAALRLRNRRLQRRARQRRSERQSRSGIDARLPPRRAPPRCCRRPRRRTRAHTRTGVGVSARELFQRHPGNPILTAADWPYPANAVFNPAAAAANGGIVLLARVEDRRGISHLTVARSANGLDGWSIEPDPLLAPDDEIASEQWGFEDPRIVRVDELGRWVITCTAYGPAGPAVFLATTEDFTSVERHGIIQHPEDKNAALLPQRIDGKWILFHRPRTEFSGEILLSRSADLTSWSAPE